MKKRVVILPMDGFPSSVAIETKLAKLMAEEDLACLISHVKLNDGLHQPDRSGPQTMVAIQELLKTLGLEDVEIFLDLKITDVKTTMVNVLQHYKEAGFTKGILTVSSSVSAEGLLALRQLLPDVKLAMVSVLTDMTEQECYQRFDEYPPNKIAGDLVGLQEWYARFKTAADPAEPFDLVVCSAKELEWLSTSFPGYGFVVPGIRDAWMEKDHQKRTSGVKWALENRATFVVMSTQLLKGSPENNISPEESRRLTKIEIESAEIPQ